MLYDCTLMEKKNEKKKLYRGGHYEINNSLTTASLPK